jgi:hypothetical protein
MNKTKNIRLVIAVECIAAIIFLIISFLIKEKDARDLVRGIATGVALGISIQFIIFRIKPGLYRDRKQAEDYNG